MRAVSAARGLLLVGSLLASGCHGYLVPYDERPLPAQGALETEGGQLLNVSGGGLLVAHPSRDDVGAALGVALHESGDGLFVSNALAPGSGLQRGDQILWAAAALPRTGAQIQSAHLAALAEVSLGDPDALEAFSPTAPDPLALEEAEAEDSGSSAGLLPGSIQILGSSRLGNRSGTGTSRPATDLLPPPREVAGFRDLACAHPVRRIADLRGYLAGAGWVELDLLVAREGTEVVLRLPLARQETWVPTRARLPALGRWRGLELVPVSTLPRELRPVAAAPDAVLVARVARSAPLGQAGLRPLDLISAEDAAVLLGVPSGGESIRAQLRSHGEVRIRARASDGEFKELSFVPRREPTQLWFPLTFAYERDASRYHFGLGWWDVLFHASGRKEYLPGLDDYVETTRWSLLTVFSGGETRTEEGTVRHAGFNLIADPIRADYFMEWAETPSNVRAERGLEGY